MKTAILIVVSVCVSGVYVGRLASDVIAVVLASVWSLR